MTILKDVTDIYDTILKLPEASNGSEIDLFVKEIFNKRGKVFQKIREDESNDRVLILEEVKKISGQYSCRSVGGDSAHRKTAYRQFAAMNRSIQELEFDIYKKEGTCNCQLRKTIGLAFDDVSVKTLSLLERVNKSYDHYDVYQCNLCEVLWVYEYLDDDDGSTRWVSWNEKDFPY